MVSHPPHKPKDVFIAFIAATGTCLLLSSDGLKNWLDKKPDFISSSHIKWTIQEIHQGLQLLGLSTPYEAISQWSEPLASPTSNTKESLAKQPLPPPPPLKASHQEPNRESPPPIPENPRVLLFGDSLMKGIGTTISRELRNNLKGQVTVAAKVSSGLVRTEYYNWFQELPKTFIHNKFDIAISFLGANDGQSFIHKSRKIAFGTKAWTQKYKQRIAKMMDISCSGAQRVYWLGLPPMRSKKFHKRTQVLNTLAKQVATTKPCVDFISLQSLFGKPHGRYSAYLEVKNQLRKVRMSDGIHLSRAGGLKISHHLVKILRPQSGT